MANDTATLVAELERLYQRQADLRAHEVDLAERGENDPASDEWKLASIAASKAEIDFCSALLRNYSTISRVLRQRGGRTLTLVGRSEAEGVEIAKRVADPNSTFYADEAAHWDALHGTFTTHRINHSEAYSDLAGTNTNQVESFFSRLRRMVAGQHHHVSPQYLHQYADHAAWLEDHRRMDNGTLAHRVAGLAMAHPVSRMWKGYWQR